MATNDFLPLATGGGANVVDQATFAALSSLLANGFQSGVANSAQINKVLRQSSFVASSVAKIIADNNVNALDDGDVAGFKTKLISAILSNIFSVANNWNKAQRGAVVALTDGVTITPDFSLANNYSITLGGNRTLAGPSNLVAGQSGVITIKQDATGSRTLAFNSAWKFAGGTVPSLTTTASATDQLAYYVNADGSVFASLNKDVK